MTTYLASLRAGLHKAFAEDSGVYLLGEDVLDPYGGAFKVTQGLSSDFPERVLTTPISEAGLAGVATGMAIRGLRPVVEVMFGDFITHCFDQMLNHATKFANLYQLDVPIIIRTPMGGGRGYGATHSQCLEKHFLGIPGLRVLAPSHLHDPGTMLRAAVTKAAGPVLFVEHKLLYAEPLVNDLPGFQIRIADDITHAPTVLVSNHVSGKPDITLITYGGASRLVLQVMKEMQYEEINILAAIPSSLDPIPVETLSHCARQSGRVLIVEEGMDGFGWGGEVARRIYEAAWSKLDRPIQCIGSVPGALPCAAKLENDMLVTADEIENALMEVLA